MLHNMGGDEMRLLRYENLPRKDTTLIQVPEIL
jgi:hypothetical protein